MCQKTAFFLVFHMTVLTVKFKISFPFFLTDPCLKVYIDLVLNVMAITTFSDLRTTLFIL